MAWSLLKERYEIDKLIVNANVKGIFDLLILSKKKHKNLRNLFYNKLDSFTRKEWKIKLSVNEASTIDSLIEFLTNRCRVLETMNMNTKGHEQKETEKHNAKSQNYSNFGTVKSTKCMNCQRDHMIHKCKVFLNLSVGDRIKRAKSLGSCLNCLKPNHYTRDCRLDKCHDCVVRHNRLLHRYHL